VRHRLVTRPPMADEGEAPALADERDRGRTRMGAALGAAGEMQQRIIGLA
jgi:hypothetical protein